MCLEQWLIMVLLLLAGAASPGPSLALVSDGYPGEFGWIISLFRHGLAISIYAFLALGVTAFSKSDLEQFSQIIHVIANLFVLFRNIHGRGGVKRVQPAAFSEETKKLNSKDQTRRSLTDFLSLF